MQFSSVPIANARSVPANCIISIGNIDQNSFSSVHRSHTCYNVMQLHTFCSARYWVILVPYSIGLVYDSRKLKQTAGNWQPWITVALCSSSPADCNTIFTTPITFQIIKETIDQTNSILSSQFTKVMNTRPRQRSLHGHPEEGREPPA